MTVRGTVGLPIHLGPLSVTDGLVQIEGRDTLLVYPFAQPQPYYTINPGTTREDMRTTDGARLLAQAAHGAIGAVQVRAGYYLMAAMLISPTGLVLSDLDPDALIYRRDEQSLIVPVGNDERWGLKPGSEIVFCDQTHYNTLDFGVFGDNPSIPPGLFGDIPSIPPR